MDFRAATSGEEERRSPPDARSGEGGSDPAQSARNPREEEGVPCISILGDIPEGGEGDAAVPGPREEERTGKPVNS